MAYPVQLDTFQKGNTNLQNCVSSLGPEKIGSHQHDTRWTEFASWLHLGLLSHAAGLSSTSTANVKYRMIQATVDFSLFVVLI